jgi:DNA-binding HxlR family transcriptional regulator
MGRCPVRRALQTLGGKHSANILHALSKGELHFLELTRVMDGISNKVLMEQLRDLDAAGLVDRTEKQSARRRVGYRLTAKGLALGAIVAQLVDWHEAFE